MQGVNHSQKSERDRKIFSIFWDFLGDLFVSWDYSGIFPNLLELFANLECLGFYEIFQELSGIF